MPVYMSPVQSVLEDDGQYDAYANLQVGANGSPYGDPTSNVGDGSGEDNWAYNTWDGDPSAGFDTSDVPISYDVQSDGNEVLTVGSQSSLTCQADSMGPIASVELDAAVQTNAEAKWSDITVQFLKAGTVEETDDIGVGPDADTIDSGSSNTAEQILTVTPTASDDDEVIVLGKMQMRSPGISTPAPQAMFCNIYINGGPANNGARLVGVPVATQSTQFVAVGMPAVQND